MEPTAPSALISGSALVSLVVLSRGWLCKSGAAAHASRWAVQCNAKINLKWQFANFSG
jgi:hypothetical protein